MSRVRQSIVFSSLNSWSNVALQLASTVIIARILTPEETGIFAVAAVFAALASTFRDFGVGEYLIQERELTDQALRAALTVNIAVSWFIGVLLYVGAPFAGEFYSHAGVADVMRVQSVNFLLIPFGAVTMAWFRREMNFKPILYISLAANVVSFVVSVVLAVKGHGYMSLAWASLAGVVVSVLGSLLARPKTLPSWPGLVGVGRVVQFGRYASGIYLFGQLGKGAPEMIIGRAADMASVGMFSRGAGLVEIFHRLVLRAILPVCLPYFASSVREDNTPKPGVLLTMTYLTAIGWVFLGFMGIAAYAAIRVLYGPQWMAAVPLAQVLCAAAAIEIVYCTSKEAMLSLSKAKESNQLQMVTEGLRILGLLAVIPLGLQGACWGLFAAAIAGAAASHWWLRAHIGLHVNDVLRALAPSAALTAVSLLPAVLLTGWFPLDAYNFASVGAVAAALTTATWLVALRALRHPLWPEMVRMAAKARGKAA